MSITAHWQLRERYTIVGNNINFNFNHRDQYITITSSRHSTGASTPLNFDMTPIFHRDSNNTILRMFTMRNVNAWFPDSWVRALRENDEIRSYDRFNTNTSRFIWSLTSNAAMSPRIEHTPSLTLRVN